MPETAKGEPKAPRSEGVGDGESVEGRPLAKGNTVGQNAPRTLEKSHQRSAGPARAVRWTVCVK